MYSDSNSEAERLSTHFERCSDTAGPVNQTVGRGFVLINWAQINRNPPRLRISCHASHALLSSANTILTYRAPRFIAGEKWEKNREEFERRDWKAKSDFFPLQLFYRLLDIHRSEISSFSSFSSCKQIGNVSKRIEISNIISLSSRRIYYIYVKKNNRRNFLSRSFNLARNDISKKDRKESSSSLVNFWRTNARSRVHAFRRVEGSGLYANECTVIHESKEEEVSGERERERERKERDVVSERRPRASRPSPLYRRPRRSHLSSSPRFTTSFLAGPRPRVRVSTRYVFDLCAHLLALNAGGEGNRFRPD